MAANENDPFSVAVGPRGFPDSAVYRAIRLVIFDVDGVLTDGRIVLDAHGVESKFFDVRDGSGLKLLEKAGLKVALLTGRSSHVVDFRARELRIPQELVKQGAKIKLPVFEAMLKESGVAPEETAFMGDDLIDLPILDQVALACCPQNAHPEVRRVCHVKALANGGRGAARAVCEHILQSRADGSWDRAIATYLGRA